MKTVILIPGRRETFTNYSDAVEAAGGLAVFSEDPVCLPAFDGLLLPGGGDIADRLPPEEERVIAAFTAAEKPILGICRGLQALNVFFGGTLYAYIPDHQSPEGDIVHATRAVGELAGLVGTEPLVNSNHHQAVHRLGAGLSVRQWAGDGVIEGICHTALPILAVQWHPERLRTGADGAAVFRWLRRCVEKGCGG